MCPEVPVQIEGVKTCEGDSSYDTNNSKETKADFE